MSNQLSPHLHLVLLIACVATILGAGFSVFQTYRQVDRPGIQHAEAGDTALAAGDTARAEQEWNAGIRTGERPTLCANRLTAAAIILSFAYAW